MNNILCGAILTLVFCGCKPPSTTKQVDVFAVNTAEQENVFVVDKTIINKKDSPTIEYKIFITNNDSPTGIKSNVSELKDKPANATLCVLAKCLEGSIDIEGAGQMIRLWVNNSEYNTMTTYYIHMDPMQTHRIPHDTYKSILMVALDGSLAAEEIIKIHFSFRVLSDEDVNGVRKKSEIDVEAIREAAHL